MHYNPYLQPQYRVPPSSYVRVLHGSPDAPAVDVYANGRLIASNLQYKQFTQYLPLEPGRYTVTIYPTGTTATAVINTSIDVMPQSNYTVAATGFLRDIKPLVVADTALPLPGNTAQIKFVNLSPNAPMVDITLPDGTMLFRNVEFREITQNLIVTPRTFTFQARIAGTNQVILNVPNQPITANRYYTIFMVGLSDRNPPLQMLIALDKASY